MIKISDEEVRFNYEGMRKAMEAILYELELIYEKGNGFKKDYVGSLIAIVQNDLIDLSIAKTKRELKSRKSVI